MTNSNGGDEDAGVIIGIALDGSHLSEVRSAAFHRLRAVLLGHTVDDVIAAITNYDDPDDRGGD